MATKPGTAGENAFDSDGHGTPLGNDRAEYSRQLVRVGGRPIAWIDHQTGAVAIRNGASCVELAEALEMAMLAWREERAKREAPVRPPASIREMRREGALESDPYALNGYAFADEFEHNTRHEFPQPEQRVRRRILDDVHAAHGMLDALGVAGGPLTARIGLALLGAPARLAPLTLSVADSSTRVHDALATADSVKVPLVDDVLADLAALSGEETFRLFDSVKVLPANTLDARDWNLMDPDDVQRMVAECCAIALDTDKLGELANAARRAVERKGAR